MSLRALAKQSTVFERSTCWIAALAQLARNDTWNLVMLRRSRNISRIPPSVIANVNETINKQGISKRIPTLSLAAHSNACSQQHLLPNSCWNSNWFFFVCQELWKIFFTFHRKNFAYILIWMDFCEKNPTLQFVCYWFRNSLRTRVLGECTLPHEALFVSHLQFLSKYSMIFFMLLPAVTKHAQHAATRQLLL